MRERLRQLGKKKIILLSAVAGIVVIAIITCIIIFSVQDNENKKESNNVTVYTAPKGYTEVIETMYVAEDTILKYADNENSKDGPELAKNEKLKIVAVNEKTGWSIVALEDDKEIIYLFIKSDKLITEIEWKSIVAQSESIAETESITAEETKTNTDTNVENTSSTNNQANTNTNTNTWVPVPSGLEVELANQLLAANSGSDTNTYEDYMLHEPFSEPWREEHYRYLLSDAFRFAQDQLNESQTIAALQEDVFTYSDSISYNDVQKAVRDCIAVKFTVTGKDFNTIQQEISARTGSVGNKFVFIQVYYNGNNNTSTTWVVKCGAPTTI